MEYLTELINLENEWKKIRMSGEEYAKAINGDFDAKNRKKSEIVAYRSRLMSSNLINEEKERMLREVKENLNYLEEKNPVSNLQKSNDNQLLTGIILGGLITILGMYFIDQMKNHLKEGISESVLNGIYSEMRKQRV